MADPTFDQISATTIAELRDDVIVDSFFVDGALQRKLRVSGALDEFSGGTIMQTPFMFDRVNGGAYIPCTDSAVTQKNIVAATFFVPKAYKEDVPVNLWQTNVINRGPNAKVKLADLYMTNAVQALNTDLALDFFRHGQSITSTTTSNRLMFINGLSEAYNDGVNPSWDGGVFTTYGGQTRNGAVGNVLNSIPIWCGDANGGANGQASYKPILEAYLDCVYEPDLGVCNKALFAYLLERQETKQQFSVEKDVTIGIVGIKVLNGYIMMDKLCPSTKYGQILPSGLSQTTSLSPSTFTSPSLSAAQTAISNMPSSKTIYPGEPFFWIRTKDWKVRPAEDPEYAFNFTPPVRSQTNPDLVVMFLKLGINFYCIDCRNGKQLMGFGF